MANYDLDYEGSEVQDILDTGKSLEDDGYIFLGTATPSTIPGTPTERVAYVGGPGTYNNFGTTVVVPSGSIVVITYSGSAWSKTVINASLPVSTTLGSDNTTIPTSKAVKDVTDAINTKLGEGYLYVGIATAATNPGTPTVKVFYLARQAGTYTNFGGLTLTEGVNILKYNGTTWSQEQLISIADIFKNPLMGYYECDTAGATAAKTVAATGYVLPTTGGSVKIKMANRNTVANATLNINSTGAKPLFYNGQRAGVGNTWDTNEIVEVFYDGTNYQAYNVAGSNGDGVFDISAYNLTDGQPTPYIDLAAALGTDGEHVPQSLRKGGMSVKFIQGSAQSSDNKYVQYRLMSDTFNTTPTNWQGVDNKPMPDSKNLIESGEVAKIAGRLDIFSGFTFDGGGNQMIVRIGAFKQGQKIFVTVDSLEFDGTLYMQIYDFTNQLIVSSFNSNGTREINFSADSDNIAFVINVNSANTYYRGYVIARSRKISTTLAPNIIEPPTTNVVYNGIKAEELYNGIHFVGGGQQILYELGDFKTGAYFGVDISNIKRNGSYNIQLVSLKTYEMFIGPYSNIADTFLSTTLNNDVERLALAINVSQDNTYISGDIKVSRSLPKRELKTLTSGNEFRILKGVFRCLYIEPTGIGIFKVSLYSGGSLISEYTFSSYRKSTQCISLDNCDMIRFINTGTNDAQFFYSLEESHKIKFLREDVDKLSMIDCYGMASPLYRSVVALPNSSTIATYENMMAKTGGIIRSVCIKPFNEGTFTFGLGTIDQRNWPIIRETFNVNIPSTDFQTIDLVSREIKVKKGEYLFVYNEKNDSENIGFLANVDNIDMCPNMLYGTEGGVNRFPKDGTTNFGAVLGLINWYIIPQNEGVDNSDKDNEIELNRRITNASFGGTHIIRDNEGNAYKITKDNNNILLSEVKYKKVLILGNSLLTGLNGYGLCATISSNDFANILLKAFLLKDNTSTISRLNAASWERTLGVTQQDFDTLFNGYTDNYDLVIIRLGENVNNVLSLRDSMDALIEYISTNYVNADIVVTSTILDYSNYNKNAALLESSLAHGIPFVNIDGSKDKYLIGIARMYTNGNVIRPSYYAIQTHSNDLGFLHIANSILSTIGYNTLNISHNIVTNSSVEVDVPQLGVENGIVTIKTYGLSAPTIVVTDANNNSLPVTHYDLSDFEFDRRFPDGTEDTATFSSTFIMPNKDVSISVS